MFLHSAYTKYCIDSGSDFCSNLFLQATGPTSEAQDSFYDFLGMFPLGTELSLFIRRL